MRTKHQQGQMLVAKATRLAGVIDQKQLAHTHVM